MIQTASPSTDIQFNPKDLLTLYQQQSYDLLSEKFIQVFEHFQKTTYFQIDESSQYFINAFIKNFLYLFTQPDYQLSDIHGLQLLKLNTVISNVVAISSFKTTDPFLEILMGQPNNYLKLLILYSARNHFKIDRKLLFDANVPLASIWYSHFYGLYISGCVEKTTWSNLKEHLNYIDDRLTEISGITDIIFGSTYIDSHQDQQIKYKINQIIQAQYTPKIKIRNRPKPNKIAVITALWFPQHSVYRIISQLVEALQGEYELTLVSLGDIKDNIDIGPFKEIRYVNFLQGELNLHSILDNDFAMALYPDVGMSLESVFLSNLRLAPIQVCSYGHSVSTFGSQIDYFIAGADAEVIDDLEQNYSERVVLLPGSGVVHNVPRYEIQNITKTRSQFILNCSWYSQKLNHAMLNVLQAIAAYANKPILFRFFPGAGLMRDNHFIPFERTVKSALPSGTVEIIPNKSYDEYMALMEEGDICIDSYPFGGCNIIADSLYLRKPTVTFESNKWYGRIGSQMLRLIGLPELIARDEKEYAKLVIKLINNDTYREKIQGFMNQVDLKATVFNHSEAQYFKQAIAYLMEHHETLKQENSQRPIMIQ